VKERPILFSGPLVRAILAGTKTVTRRPCKQAVDADGKLASSVHPDGSGTGWIAWFSECAVTAEETRQLYPDADGFRCPFGLPGDRLYVRETWAEVHPLQVASGRYSQDGQAGIPGPPSVNYRVIYRADGECPRIHFQTGEPCHPWREACEADCQRSHKHPEESPMRWTPSIHMPRWASRITLDVVSVRVERLHDITDAEAVAEGVRCWACNGPVDGTSENDCDCFHTRSMARDSFSSAWSAIYGARSWDSNPWVWRVEFRRVQP
jgi:hypothetical protein